MSHRLRLPLLAIAIAGLAAASAAPAKTPPLSFYEYAGASPARGTVIRSLPISGGSLPANGRSHLVLYGSRAPDGEPIAVSGIVTVPKGPAPRGGFPVVSWAHGTTGIADVCAPSRGATDRPSNPYVVNFRRQVSQWLAQGWAVVQTDYQGLGTAGMHHYLVGPAEGRGVLDIVAAARDLDDRVGRRFAIVGHSQGGHAALWAASLAGSYVPRLRLAGVVPVAPASHIGEQAAAIDSIEGNPFGGLPALIIAGALDHAGLDPATVLSDRALAMYPQVEAVCLDALSEPDSFGGLSLSEHFREGYDTSALVALANANDPEELTLKTPALILQGEGDTTVFPAFTEQVVDALRSHGSEVSYRTYPGVGHSPIVEASRGATLRFLRKVLG